MVRWDSLPDDTLLEIFRWLPADALARCSSVNRNWKRVIDNEAVLWQRHARHVSSLYLCDSRSQSKSFCLSCHFQQQLESHWLPSAVYSQPSFFERLPKYWETYLGIALFAGILIAALFLTGPLSVLLGMLIVSLNGKTPMLFSLHTIRNRGLQLTLISTLATVSVGASLGFILKSVVQHGCDSIWMDVLLSCLLQFSLTARMLRLYSKVFHLVRAVLPSVPPWVHVLGLFTARLVEFQWLRLTRKLTPPARRGLRILLAAAILSAVIVSAWWTMSLLFLAAIALVAHTSAAYILSEGCATHEDMCFAGLMLVLGRVTLRGVLAMIFGYSVIPGLGFAVGGTIALALLNAVFLRVPKMETDALTGLLIMCVMYPVLAPALLVLLVLRICFGAVIGSPVTLLSFRCDGASRTVLQEPVVRLPPRRSYPLIMPGPCPQRLFMRGKGISAGECTGCSHHHRGARGGRSHSVAVPASVQAGWWDAKRLREVVGKVTEIERNWYHGRCRMSEVPVSALCRLSAMSGDYVLSSAFLLDLHSGCFLRCYVQMLAGFSFHVMHGRQLLVGHGDQLKVFAVPSLSPIRRQQLPQDFGRTVCATVDDESMLVAQQDGVSLVDLQTFQVTGSIPISGTLHVALDERFVAVATSRAVHVYSRASLNHLCDIPIATSVLLLAQGRCFVRHQFDLYVYAAETGVLLHHISFADTVKPTGFGASVVVSGAVVALAQGSSVHIHCLHTLQQLYKMEFDCYYVESLAASATRLAVMARNHPEVKWSGALQKPTFSLFLLDFLNP